MQLVPIIFDGREIDKLIVNIIKASSSMQIDMPSTYARLMIIVKPCERGISDLHMSRSTRVRQNIAIARMTAGAICSAHNVFLLQAFSVESGDSMQSLASQTERLRLRMRASTCRVILHTVLHEVLCATQGIIIARGKPRSLSG